MILHRKDENIEFNKINSGHKDILAIKGVCYKQKMRIVLVYFGVKKNNPETDKANKEMMNKVVKIMEKGDEDEAQIILGDFNAHTGTVGYQNPDHNGKLLHNMANEHDMIILNYDDKCKGEVTWKRGNRKSSIDFIVVNKLLYDKFIDMNIDEDEDIWYLSDHNLLTARFKIRRHKQEKKCNNIVEREYLSKDKKAVENFRLELENQWKDMEIKTVQEMMLSMDKTANNILKKTYKKKEIKGEEKKEEKPWMTEEIRKELKNKRKINKARRKEKDEQMKERLWNEYKAQREKVKRLIRESIETHEIMLTNKIKEKRMARS